MSSDKATKKTQGWMLTCILCFILGSSIGAISTAYMMNPSNFEPEEAVWVTCLIDRIQIEDRPGLGTGSRMLYSASIAYGDGLGAIQFKDDVAFFQVFHVGDVLSINVDTLSDGITNFKDMEYHLLHVGKKGLFQHSEEASQ